MTVVPTPEPQHEPTPPQRPASAPAPEHHGLVKHIAAGLRHRCGVREGDTLVVGCSGGADSVALLRALHLLAGKRKWNLQLVVAHVNHHLRDTAQRDAVFVEQLADTLGLPFALRGIDCAPPATEPGSAKPLPGADEGPDHPPPTRQPHPPALPALPATPTTPATPLPRNLEARARKLRYAALAEVAEAHDARFIATAHHADDQLETLLMRLMRGAGVRGLRGIAWQRRLPPTLRPTPGLPPHNSPPQNTPPSQGLRSAATKPRIPRGIAPGISPSHTHTATPQKTLRLIRPMLAATRDTARDFLAQLAQPWVEDETNTDTSRRRALLRHTLTPTLQATAPRLAERTPDLHDHFADLHRLVRDTAAAHRLPLPRATARGLNPAVLAEVLRRALHAAGIPRDRLTRRALRPLLQAVRDRAGGTRRFAFAHTTLRLTAEQLELENKT